MYILYWSLQGRRNLQNVLLLIGSYVFYGWWDYRFLGLLFISSFVDYWVGRLMPQFYETKKAKWLLWVSLFVNLGMLFVFKYYDFFITEFQEAFASVGVPMNVTTLNIILPVGISFYTFQTLSYTIDVYQKEIKPTHNAIDFFAYVSFFPQLVAGPIERASSLLPQFQNDRQKLTPEVATDALRQILWGFFKKMVIADNLGVFVDQIFGTYTQVSAITLLMGGILFAIQVYSDFSGYSDIAIGIGKLFGFKLMTNFRVPMISKNIPEFWSKWHISMTTWFRDYVFKPMAKQYGKGPISTFICVIVLFMVIGFWHGANWTFIVFGLINGLLFIPAALRRVSPAVAKFLDSLYSTSFLSGVMILGTFLINGLTSVFFRAPDIQTAIGYFVNMIFYAPWTMPDWEIMKYWWFLCVPCLTWEGFMSDYEHQFDIAHFPQWLRWLLYYFILLCIVLLGNFGKPPFIYFQF